MQYGVTSVSRIHKIIGLFCKRALQKTRYSAKETYYLIDPTNRSHPIAFPRVCLRLCTQTAPYICATYPHTLCVYIYIYTYVCVYIYMCVSQAARRNTKVCMYVVVGCVGCRM